MADDFKNLVCGIADNEILADFLGDPKSERTLDEYVETTSPAAHLPSISPSPPPRV